jgi:acyl-coenzyme A thioesterase PaaI-like protein
MNDFSTTQQTLLTTLDIKLIEQTKSRVVATMPVGPKSGQVEAVQVHHLVPGRHEVTHELPAARRCSA